VTRDEIVARIRPHQPGRNVRGDHDFNPEIRPHPPLKPAAVLVPIVAWPNGMTVLLTQRTDHLADHAGQISFPGGRIEPQDEGPEDAALRETEEEIGLPRDQIELIGRLDTYETSTGYEVVPVVGFVHPPFVLLPDPHEVADIFEVPLAFILDPANHERRSRAWQGGTRQFFVLPYEQRYIWGATAGMLVNLAQVLGAE
jgi:8-oxo-dGTP pyrophosphatase MutT (NUDIX family)